MAEFLAVTPVFHVT